MGKAHQLAKYIEQTTGEQLELLTHAPALPPLPNYFRLGFEFWTGNLLGRKCLFLYTDRVDDIAVIALEKQLELLKKKTDYPVVFVFDSLPARTAHRLIKRKIPFVAIENQVFLPFLLISLKLKRDLWDETTIKKALSPAAESILIGQLLKAEFDGKSGIEIARVLRELPMTVSKALRELASRKLCRLESRGKKKVARFEEQKMLWSASKSVLKSPIQTIELRDHLPKVEWVYSGVTALSQRSMLSEDRTKTVALFRRDFNAQKQHKPTEAQIEDSPRYRLEIWNRKPSLYAKDKTVDPISLYLSLKDEPDERVQIELERLMRGIGLSISEKTNA